MRSPSTLRASRPGFALVTVVLVLAALLLLCTPFLMTARNADQASQQLFHQAEARIALDNAATHARAILQRSHPSLDSSLYSDGLEELRVPTEFADGFLDAHDAQGVMWDVRVGDVAGSIDLASVPPQVIGAMLGRVSRLVKPLESDETGEVPLASTKGFDPSGHIWIGGELIHYEKIEGNTLLELERGVGAYSDNEDAPLPGPLPPSTHPLGTIVLDQRAMAPAEWRLYDGDVRSFDSLEQFAEVGQYTLPGQPFTKKDFESIARLGSVDGGVGAGVRWQRAARMTTGATAEVDDSLGVDSARWFNVGSTIRISAGGAAELAIVRRISSDGRIYLDRGLRYDYDAYEAEVSVLARRPVNINSASREVLLALMTNLKLTGRNSRITGSEAGALADVIIESRPFDGFEDFTQRLILPAAGIAELPSDAPVVPDAFAGGGTGALISPFDALALSHNALNANDFALEYSSMPFCFTTRDVYDLSLRAVINGASGVERYSSERDETLVAIPQQELTRVWAAQEDYDDELRLGREAPYWGTGPLATSHHDSAGSQPPTRIWAQLGTYEGEIALPGVPAKPKAAQLENAPSDEQTFAQRGSADGYAQLFHTEVDESADLELSGRMLHFTHESGNPEGRDLAGGTIQRTPDDTLIQWDPNATGLLRGIQFSCWLKPRSLADAHLLDVAGSGSSSQDADRVELLFEGGDLVLRCLDGGGDHQDTTGFREAAEVRYALVNDGTSPGLPLDVWSHIAIDVRGSRPSQMLMMVNGLSHGVRTLGLTHLTAPLSPNDSTLQVESTEGFPPRGVLRIGDELIEYRVSGGGFDATFIATGPDAGFGGRNARVVWIPDDQQPQPANLVAGNMNHPTNAAVELYGYSLALAADTTAGQASLPDQLGAFRVGTVNSVVGPGNQFGEQISIVQVNLFGVPVNVALGLGIKPGSQITGLNLGVAETPDDQNADVASVMAAFNPAGGYACLMQVGFGPDADGNRIGGWEVIRYNGWSGTTLDVKPWGNGVTELSNLSGQTPGSRAARSFVVHFDPIEFGGVRAQDILSFRLFIMPISLAVPDNPSAFLPATIPNPQFAQITELGAGERTEWVAYNSIQTFGGGQLVRDDPAALDAAYLAAVGVRTPQLPDPPGQPGSGGGGLGGQPIMAATPGAPAQPSAPAALGSAWEPMLGENELENFPISRAVSDVFQFRGVLGTHSHQHAASTAVLPVFRAVDQGLSGGRPGRFDPVFLMAADFSALGWPVTIYRGHQPDLNVLTHGWTSAPGSLTAVAAGGGSPRWPTVGGVRDWYFALNAAAPAPLRSGTVQGAQGLAIVDSRGIGRLLRFPSGERARGVRTVTVGSAFDGSGVASALIDEVAFGATNFGMTGGGVGPESLQAAQLTLRQDFPGRSGPNLIRVNANSIRIPLFNYSSSYEYLKDLDQNGGLVRIGEEILAYSALNTNLGDLTVAQGGRGLLGTLQGAHETGNNLTFLDSYRVGILANNVGAADATLALTSTRNFPREGTVLVGRELIHYTRIANGGLDMPRASSEAGRKDGRGDGIFRGRYGTSAVAHKAGEPVILFPMRYWDRFAPQVDGPELAYFGIEIAQPAAFWRSFSWSEQSVGLAGVALGVLMRTDSSVPWDADPEVTKGLELFHLESDKQSQWIGHQAPGVEWRVFVEYTSGAFDVDTGMGHAWRTSPRLDNFFVDYIGPSMTLRSVQR